MLLLAPSLAGHRTIAALALLCISLFFLLCTHSSISQSALDQWGLSSHEANLDLVVPQVDYGDHKYRWITDNQRETHRLFACIERGDCAQNQTKVVILLSYEFNEVKSGGYIGGEGIWALSTIRALGNMGYTILYSTHIMGAIQLYHIFDSLVKMVLMHPNHVVECYDDKICLKTELNPAGVPAWKIFAFYFWQNSQTPHGRQWTLSPEDYGTNTYLGYSIEAQCALLPFIPHAQREKQVYILAKFWRFFEPNTTAWPPEFYDAAAVETGVRFITGSDAKNQLPKLEDVSKHIHNLGGILSLDAFYLHLTRSIALLGINNPAMSPTPYDGLCLGVPFINVVQSWDKSNPEDRSRWHTQHNPLKEHLPPYVYHVKIGDRDGFIQAIRDAIENPIPSYILDRMKMSSVQERFGRIIEHDWRREAEELMERRRKGLEEGELFVI